MGAVALVVLGFALAEIGALLRGWLGSRKRDKALVRAARDEVSSLIAVVQNNQALVQRELGLLAQQQPQHLVNPLDPIPTGFWEAVRWNPPRQLAKGNALSQTRDVARRTQLVNSIIESRETFRMNNMALSGLHQTLQSYDQLLQQFQGELLTALQELEPLLANR
jgi:hypothetical protein